ncbi:MAG: hypothetical protein ATN31_05485 [Candidatus Epulonipiscioides saccharophilum]|nr:MAG: hypothetical protein ATN31_05485 [Epulopiscium sp. AS2M-Bin001]
MITVAQVANANEVELLCITYELFLDKLNSIISNPDLHPSNSASYKRDLLKILSILVSNLDMNIQLSHDIFDLYIFTQKLVINNDYEAAYEIISQLKQGYNQLKKSDLKFKATTTNVENIYVGMTYNRSCINEIVCGSDNRGYII